MKPFIPAIASLCLSTLLVSCNDSTSPEQSKYEPTPIEVASEYDRDMASLIDTANAPDLNANFEQFARNIYRESRINNKDQNFMISPFSISTALSMTMNGSANHTTTEMLNGLSLENVSLKDANSYNSVVAHELTGNKELTFNNANSIWVVDKYTPLKRSFHDVVTNYYLADIFPLTTVDPVNQWISDQTNGKIPKMLDQLSENTVMLLVNAVYFLGNWEEQFKKEYTHTADFTLTSGEKVQTDMMHMTHDFQYKRGKEYLAVSIPYKDQETSLYVFITDSNTTLEQFIYGSFRDGTSGGYYTAETNYDTWKTEWNWIDDNKESLFSNFTTGEVSLALPKFKFKSEASLKAPLENLGMDTIFSEESDFTNFCEGKDPFVARVLHKSFIEVNETGTEAAAATVVDVTDSMVPMTIEAKADRPFLFCIRNNDTKTILFLGQVTNPTEE